MTGLFQRGWPTMPVYNEDGSYYVSSLDPIHSSYIEGNFNPIADINGTTATNSSFRALGDIYAEFQLLKNLKFKTTWGADINNIRKYSYTSSQTATNIATNGTGAGNNAYHRNITKLTENMLTYNNTWEITGFLLQEFIHGKNIPMKICLCRLQGLRMMLPEHGI